VVAIVGVDQLKQYQNQYGRPVAEQVLRLVVPKIMAAAGTGKVYRLAGDELTLLFTARTATDTLATFEKIRKTVEQISLRLRNQTRVWEGSRAPGGRIKDLDLPLSASIGVAEATPPGPLLTVVTKTAYRALYEAKGEGGNIVRRATMQAAPVKSAPQPTGRIVAYSEFDR
jgi:GGDEF domain-containing protein